MFKNEKISSKSYEDGNCFIIKIAYSFRSSSLKNTCSLFLEKCGFTTPHNSLISMNLLCKITLNLAGKYTTSYNTLTSIIIRSFFIITPLPN